MFRKDGYDARVVANWFIRHHAMATGGGKLSIMSLLKLVYIAHGWHLEIFDKPLIRNPIQAWQYGPVIPDVYDAFRPTAINLEVSVNDDFNTTLGDEKDEFLKEVYSIYGKYDGPTLSMLTHVKDGPWDRTWKIGGEFEFIYDGLIKKHYRSLRKRLENETEDTARGKGAGKCEEK